VGSPSCRGDEKGGLGAGWASQEDSLGEEDRYKFFDTLNKFISLFYEVAFRMTI